MSSQSPDIRIVKKKKGHAGHHGGAWKVAYADFVTAMMAFFLVMWIVGLGPSVRDAVAGYFKDPMSFMEATKGGNAPFSVGDAAGEGQSDQKDPAQGGGQDKPGMNGGEQEERRKLEAAKEQIEKAILGLPEFQSLKSHVDIRLSSEGLKVDLLEDKENLFFDSASAVVKPATKKLLAQMAAEFKKLPNRLIIEGHTDSRPLARRDGYTNWELSADRANSARKVMEAAGLSESQISQVRGYAATQPRDPKHPEHFSNRRVSIVVVMNETLRRQEPEAVPTEDEDGKLVTAGH